MTIFINYVVILFANIHLLLGPKQLKSKIMKKKVLISGASIAGLTLAYWLNRYNYEVTVVEISKGLRRGGAPVDVRGKALKVATEMGIIEKIKANEFKSALEMVNSENETIIDFSINDQPEYKEDMEIQRGDLVEILYERIPKDQINFYFGDRIRELVQDTQKVEARFKSGNKAYFDFVFGADGIHSGVRKLIFGEEKEFSEFYGEYYALVDTPDIKPHRPQIGTMYNEPGKMVTIFPFEKTVGTFVVFKSSKLDWDYRNVEQHKEILKENFKSKLWRIPEILDAILDSDNLFFDEVSQIHMSTWSKGRVALAGDAAYAASFHTGMGTSLAMEGAYILAKELNSNDSYKKAFDKYYKTYKPFTEEMQARITRGLKYLVPETEEGIKETIERFKKTK